MKDGTFYDRLIQEEMRRLGVPSASDRENEESLDFLERLMDLEEGFEIDDDDWLQGSGVPRQGPFPGGAGGIELALPPSDDEIGREDNE